MPLKTIGRLFGKGVRSKLRAAVRYLWPKVKNKRFDRAKSNILRRLSATLLVGNRADWRESIVRALTSKAIKLVFFPLTSETINFPEIDVILPFLLPEYDVVRMSAVASLKSLIPRATSVNLADDKLQFNNWLLRIGCGHCVPKMFARDPPFPFIRKKRIDEWGANSKVFFCEEQVRSAGVDFTDCDYFLQECISGHEEYVTHTISVSGVITYSISFRNAYDKPLFIKGNGEEPKRVENLGGLVPLELSEIIRLLDYSGCACFNYKLIKGVPMIFEMNPRVGASFSRMTDQYLEGYLDSVRWHQKRLRS